MCWFFGGLIFGIFWIIPFVLFEKWLDKNEVETVKDIVHETFVKYKRHFTKNNS